MEGKALKYHSMRTQSILLSAGALALFTVIALLVLYPLIALFLASFRPGQELIRYGLNLNPDPKGLTLSNYIYLFTQKAVKDGEWVKIPHKYFMWYKNSLFLTSLSVCFTLFFCYAVFRSVSPPGTKIPFCLQLFL